MLQIRHLDIGYGKRAILTDLNAELPSNVLTALVGRNGCGKSTLLRTLAGLQTPLGGEIEPKDRGPKKIAVVLTDRIDAPGLTVEEVVALGRIPHTNLTGHISRKDREIVERAIERCNLTPLINKAISAISDGERQRTMIARAIAQDTPVILLDEPTAFLDFPSKVETLKLLSTLCREEAKTILLSSHDLEITFQMADNLWLLSPDGLQSGAPQTLAEEGCIARMFPEIAFDAETMRFVTRTP